MIDIQESDRRVVITGMGLVSPVGSTTEEFFSALTEGRCGISQVESLAATAFPGNYAGEVKGFDSSTIKAVVPKRQRKFVRVMCREIQLGVTSASLAMESSGVDAEQIDHSRLGVEFGANQMFSPPWVLKMGCDECLDPTDGHFEYDRWGIDGLRGMEPLWLLKYLPNMPACHIGIIADARGPNNSLTLAEASGNLVLGEAFRVIKRNAADLMIAGTGGSRLNPIKTIHAAMWNELAEPCNGPETMCRPFDADRNGQVPGEGACSLILEEESHARERGATIYGTLLSSGASCVVDRDGRADSFRAMVNAMQAALKSAGVAPEEIGHINAHGLGERQADAAESRAIAEVFGAVATSVPVTSLKGHLGNSGAACGTLEIAGSLLGLRAGVVPPTLNYQTPDPECPLNVVHGQPLATANKVFLNVNVTAQGQASAVVVCGA